MTVTEDAHYSPYDVRHASATVSGEEPLLTPRGTRPIAAQWVRMEWTHGHDEPWLEVGGTPLFKRPRRIRAGGDSIVRRFLPSAYRDTLLPEWITEFYQRHDPNPPRVRTWRLDVAASPSMRSS